jgi:bifunctional UDP-N-acetylglucosamine pyrophosphorylase/glucosamine-1-phosphate N-acetyltransferase
MANADPVAVVLAAGKSTRMKSETPKVLHDLCGRSLAGWVLEALREAGVHRSILVVGYREDLVRAEFAGNPGVSFVTQAEQKGTGHAVRVCREQLLGHGGPVIVLAGDGPFVRAELLATMLRRFHETGAAAYMATAAVTNPFGYGRIIRDAAGGFARIVEQKDASPAEAAVREINPSFYVFDGPALLSALERLQPNNAQGEYYLTDVPALLLGEGRVVVAEPVATESDIFGINDRGHLAEAHAMMQDRILRRHFVNGVTIVDARNVSIDARATIGKDTVILPFTAIHGEVTIGAGCRIGPFAHLRPGTVIRDGAEAGAFVEINRSDVGSGTVIRHLAYLGDATLGAGVNVGAGFVTANFDGSAKHPTVVEDRALLGAGSVVIAPNRIGAGATLGAGAVLTKETDLAPGAVAVGVPAEPLGG